jgi:hypothetical protein
MVRNEVVGGQVTRGVTAGGCGMCWLALPLGHAEAAAQVVMATPSAIFGERASCRTPRRKFDLVIMPGVCTGGQPGRLAE